ncbi:MAG: hypothetical protein WDN66_00575 [Candidatus Saccharibacteria bacterium]
MVGLVHKNLSSLSNSYGNYSGSFNSSLNILYFGLTPTILNTTIAIMAAGAPLFLIPFAFKLSGGAIGQVHGAVSGITHRGKQATNNLRQNNRKDRGERARNGQLFRGNSRLAKFNSGLAQGAMLAPKSWP